ncbi:hypothetical protein TWF694_005216 [Orbilia ellipsospora]|uniref:Uncharacterized protein n=1 Tax=Orbilia ellipsospora TaxID=2528407 RepID=A0AAV9WWA9_9PEZI
MSQGTKVYLYSYEEQLKAGILREKAEKQNITKEAVALIGNGSIELRPPVWTREDLLEDFRNKNSVGKLKDGPSFHFIEAGVTKLLTLALGGEASSAGAFLTLDFLGDLLKEKVHEKAVGEIVGIAVEGKKPATKAIRRMGGQIILLSLGLTHPVATVLGAAFTIFIYLQEKDKEKQELINERLANSIEKRYQQIRKKTREKLEQKNLRGMEEWVARDIRASCWDDTKFGYYMKDGKSYVFKNSDLIALRDRIRCDIEKYISSLDILLCAAYLGINPELKLDESQEERFNKEIRRYATLEGDYQNDTIEFDQDEGGAQMPKAFTTSATHF